MSEESSRFDPDTITHSGVDLTGLRALVAGLGVSGTPAARVLLERGADVTVVDGSDTPALHERAHGLPGIRLLCGPSAVEGLPPGPAPDLVVTSPGWRADSPLLAAAAAARIPIWGEVELAWRLRPAQGAAPWLTLTGTNGKTTTVGMLQAMLTADGRRAVAAGNIGTPLLDAVLADDPYDVIAVELSSFQLHWAYSPSPLASACLNVADDHTDWHGSAAAYAAAKGRVYERTRIACVHNVQDPVTEELVRNADVVEGCRAVGFTLGTPAVSMLGVVDDVLCDRAFVEQRDTSAAELATLRDVQTAGGGTLARHNISNALAAAALARAYGVRPSAVRDGLRGYVPGGHRIATVAQDDDVRWVDDSKATNPHAAQASLAAFDSVVWIAGGLAKGARFDDLVAANAPRLRAVVLIGRDRALLAESLARHASDIPVVDLDLTETGPTAVMDQVVRVAGDLARPGDTVLLAPACASMDMFDSYAHRGDAFAAAVRRRLGGDENRDAGRGGGRAVKG